MLQSILDYVSISQGIAVIIGIFIFTTIQIRQQKHIANTGYDQEKKRATIEFYNRICLENDAFLFDTGDELRACPI